MKAIRQSVNRITWVLREVLPQMLHPEDQLEGGTPVPGEREPVEKEYRRPPA
jgi:hypothetical protein